MKKPKIITTKITNEEQSANLGNWLICFGEHIRNNPSLLIEATIRYQPKVDDSLAYNIISYKNACEISFFMVKKVG
jgi:hypothetical protein